MAARSNFKRAQPQAQPSLLASLRNTQMMDESKAILPAGMYYWKARGFGLTDT